jgi:hypothetical protein
MRLFPAPKIVASAEQRAKLTAAVNGGGIGRLLDSRSLKQGFAARIP